MGFTIKTSTGGTGAADTASATVISPAVLAGDLICITLSWTNDGVSATVSDGASTFAGVTAYSPGGGGQRWIRQFWCLSSVATGTPTYTMTATGSTGPSIVVYVFTPSAAVTDDGSNGNTGSGFTIGTGGVTTTGSDELIVCSSISESNPTPSGWLIGGADASTNATGLNNTNTDLRTDMWYLAGSTGTISGAMTIDASRNWAGAIMSFKTTGGGSSSTIVTSSSIIRVPGARRTMIIPG